MSLWSHIAPDVCVCIAVQVQLIDEAVLLFGTIYATLSSPGHRLQVWSWAHRVVLGSQPVCHLVSLCRLHFIPCGWHSPVGGHVSRACLDPVCLPRAQLLEHFAATIKGIKPGARSLATQINIFTAILAALKAVVERKTTFGQDKVVAVARSMAMAALANADPMLRVAAAEMLGRLAQAVAGPFVGEVFAACADRVKSDKDVESRTGFALALGCLHRCVGGIGGSRHLHTSVSLLQTAGADANPVVQTWALHALMLTVDSAGYHFDSFINSTLDLVNKIVLAEVYLDPVVHQCAGKVGHNHGGAVTRVVSWSHRGRQQGGGGGYRV